MIAAAAATLVVAALARAAHSVAAPASTQVLDRFDHPLRTFLSERDERCEPVPLDRVSRWLVLATLAAEDRRFFAHHGVDWLAVLRACGQNLLAGRVRSGASTLTEQTIRLGHPRARTWRAKLAEAREALALERLESKDRILETYLNGVPYGHGCRGAQAAARAYFGVDAADLSLAQAALLAGLPKAPARLDPLRFEAAARRRQRTVLDRLARWGWADARTVAMARRERPSLAPVPAAFRAPQFALRARREAGDSRGPIVTTLDGPLQDRLQALLRAHLTTLAGHHVTNGALVALDNATGDVLAWVGSADFGDDRHAGQVDGVTARRQPGSSLKPFLYGVSLAADRSPADLLRDEPFYLANGHTPRNYDESYHGLVRLREALACSYNVPAMRVAQEVGPSRLLDALHRFGFASLDRPASWYGLGLALGGGEVTLLELANGYATLARGGEWRPVRMLRDGAPPDAGPLPRSLEATAVGLVTDILADNAARAAAFGLNSPLHLPFPFAAKTGTTKDYRDNWAIGYTPEWTIAVWVGNPNGEAMRHMSGITGAAPLLHDAAMELHARYGSSPFAPPEACTRVEICPVSGLPRGRACPGGVIEYVRNGRESARVCPLAHDGDEGELEALAAPQVEFPRPNDIFRIDPASPRDGQAIRLSVAGAEPADVACWSVDGAPVDGDGPRAFWPVTPGWHRVDLEVARAGALLVAKPVRFLVAP